MQTKDFGTVGEDIDTINKRLKDIYGETLEGRVKFRVVKADEQFEKRKGRYRDFAPGTNLLIRDVYEVREVYKYPSYLGFHVLEKSLPIPTQVDDIKNHNTYELLWVFRNKDYTVQPLYWRAIAFLCNSSINGVNKSLAETWEEREKIEEKELNYFIDYLSSEAPAFDGALNAGEAVVVDGLKGKVRVH